MVFGGGIEPSGDEAEGDVVEESRLFVFFGVEEETESFEDVFEQVICHYLSLDTSRQSLQVLIILIQINKSILLPKIVKMLLNLRMQILIQRLPIRKDSQMSQPYIKLTTLISRAHLSRICRDNFYRRTHDI